METVTRFIPHSVLSAHLNINSKSLLDLIRGKTHSDSAEYIRADCSLSLEGNNFNHVKLVNFRGKYEVLEELSNLFARRPIWSDDIEESSRVVVDSIPYVDGEDIDFNNIEELKF